MKKIALFILGLLAILYLRQKIAAGATETAKSGIEFAEIGYFKEQGAMGSERRVYSVAVEGFVDNESVWNEIQEHGRKKCGAKVVIRLYFSSMEETIRLM